MHFTEAVFATLAKLIVLRSIYIDCSVVALIALDRDLSQQIYISCKFRDGVS